MDEVSNQLVGETRRPPPAEPGQALSDEYKYQRNGICNLFMFFDPLLGWRHVKVTELRTRLDWAWAMKTVVDGYYPSPLLDASNSPCAPLPELCYALSEKEHFVIFASNATKIPANLI